MKGEEYHRKNKPFIEPKNPDLPKFIKRQCTDKQFDAVAGFMNSNGRNYRFNDDVRLLLRQLIYNLIHTGSVQFRVGHGNTIEKRLRDRLLECGLIEWDRGHCYLGSSWKHSMISPTPLFHAVLNQWCQLKVGNKPNEKHEGYWEDLKSLKELMGFNEFMSSHDLHSPIGSINPIHRFNYLTHPVSKEIFRNRLINEGHSLKREQRSDIQIDGQSTASFDVTATHPQFIFHSWLGRDMEIDPYDIGSGNRLLRDAAKLALMIMLNTSTRRGAIAALLKELNEPDKMEVLDEVKRYFGTVSRVISAIEERNPDLKPFFYERKYVELQHHEANIMWLCQLKLMELGIPSLSVHDDLRIRIRDFDVARRVYEKSWMEETGIQIKPKIKSKDIPNTNLQSPLECL